MHTHTKDASDNLRQDRFDACERMVPRCFCRTAVYTTVVFTVVPCKTTTFGLHY